MNPLSDDDPRQRRHSVRHQARLDAETYTTLEDLAKTFHRKHGAILRYVLQWRLSQSKGWTIDQSIPASMHPVPVLLEPELLQQVHNAAAIHGASVAAWIRHTMRHITLEDCSASWRTGERASRSYESGYYHRKFGLRLDA